MLHQDKLEGKPQATNHKEISVLLRFKAKIKAKVNLSEQSTYNSQ